VAVRRNLAEPERFVERPRRSHRRDRVEAHAPVTEVMRDGDRGLGERTSRTGAAARRAHVEALHLTDVGFEGAHGNAADRFRADASEQERTGRRRVVARELCELPLEVLEREVEPERGRVFLEEPPRVCDVVGGSRDDLDYARQTTSPPMIVAATTGPPR
jgi:hypothetical protein